MIFASIKLSEKTSPEFEALKKSFKGGTESYVTIGVHEDAGKYTTGSNSPLVVEVALWNEFGTKDIPERSFFRSTIDEQQSRIEAYREQMVGNILSKGWPVQKALEAIGLFVQTLIQNKIRSNVAPVYGTGKGNSPERISQLQAAKIKRTGHTNTLRESELLLRSITFKVHA